MQRRPVGHLRPARHRDRRRPRRCTGRSSTTTAASPAGRSSCVIEDNGYDVPTHLEKYEHAVPATRCAMFSQSTGSPHTAAIAEDLVEDDLIAIPLSWYSGWADPEIGAERLRDVHQLLLRVDERHRVARTTNRDVQTVAIVSFPGEYGQDGAAGAKTAAEALGLEIVYDGEGQVTPPSADNPNPDQSGVIAADRRRRRRPRLGHDQPDHAGRDHGRRRRPGLHGHCGPATRRRTASSCSAPTSAPLLDEYYIALDVHRAWGTDVPGMRRWSTG